ncbi:uncharacterized protein LOC106872867 [Octopus bimaculoides]|uniref:Uncharacterized protein n=1 Tax=Octopus bimaculoides TaxID=37653 RepID=A0A0L8H4B1_OCTBM|nr:uncharacterized protein LOC106872867 [Octopus bimaculoides]|eukprot:XP_014775491.1 PREDICTED: uncharacterized protein LOC106872867 [Octopus bimaculoides]
MDQFKRYSTLAQNYLALSPELSRYFMFKALKNKSDEENKCWCQTCGTYYFPNNLKVRLSPKLTLNKHIKSLVKRYKKDPDSLKACQQSLALHYLNGRNKLVLTCQVCHTKKSYKGKKRLPIKWTTPSNSTDNSVEDSKLKKQQLVLEIMSEMKSKKKKASSVSSEKQRNSKHKKTKKQPSWKVKCEMKALLNKESTVSNDDSLLNFLLNT